MGSDEHFPPTYRVKKVRATKLFVHPVPATGAARAGARARSCKYVCRMYIYIYLHVIKPVDVSINCIHATVCSRLTYNLKKNEKKEKKEIFA